MEPRVLPLFLLTVLFAGCSFQPENGQTFTGSNVGRALAFSGWAILPGATIQMQVLNPASQNPYSPTATWTTLATTTADLEPTYWNDPDPIYHWALSGVVPVPNVSALPRWPQGSVGRFRVLHNGNAMVSFNSDFGNCLAANFNSSWETIGLNCASDSNPVIGLVDTDPQPPSGLEFLSLKGTALSEAEEYYAAIGAAPGQLRRTFAGFKSANGFVPGATETVTYYFNAGDLEFGREMHCRIKGIDFTLACYVSNFITANETVPGSGATPFATVAMETAFGPNDVRFYVYDSAGTILPAATLDSEGAKPVPGICLACHGGIYNPSTNTVTGANFLPFDVYSFEYPTVPGFSFEDQENAFQTLNTFVAGFALSDQAVTDLINGWYASSGGLFNESAVPDPDYVPTAWSTGPDLYLNVVAPYCRTCHVAQGASKDWDSSAEFKAAAIASFVCGSKIMPHAEVPFEKFWQSGARAHLVNQLPLADACDHL